MSRIKIRVTTKGAGDGGRAPRRTVRTSARTPRGGRGGKNVVRRTRKA